MFTLTGFGDEISPILEEQLDALESEGIKYLEIRGVNNKNILDLTDAEINNVKDILKKYNFKVSAIASPIGKISIKDDFEQHLVRFRQAIKLSKMLSTNYIRIFSYYIPTNEDPMKYRNEVLARMKKKTEIAERENVILLHENEHGIYGQTPQRCKDIIESIGSNHLKCLFDPANFVVEGIKPYKNAFSLLEKYIVYLHIKDAKHTPDGKVKMVAAGEGEGEIKEVLSALKQKHFDMFLSLEPHLAIAGVSGGFTGRELFHKATESLKKILNEI